MVGNLAFVGLSQVRETAVFSGIQITERLQETERTCGVWVVDIQRGQVVAFLKFEEAVQEIFAVALLPGMRFPDLINDNAELVGSSFVLAGCSATRRAGGTAIGYLVLPHQLTETNPSLACAAGFDRQAASPNREN